MTTNAGAAELTKSMMGFTPSQQSGDEMAEIKRMFTPEFRNRLDAVISFNSLDRDIIMRVVDKFLMQLEQQLEEKKVEPTFTPALRAYLAEKGFDPQMGARPMARLIQDTIRSALADELLFGRLAHGGKVTVDLGQDQKIRLISKKSPPASPEPDPPSAKAPAPAGAFCFWLDGGGTGVTELYPITCDYWRHRGAAN